MKHQTDELLTHYINKYGCFYMDMCYWFKWKTSGSEPTYAFLNGTWEKAINDGIISGDTNHDGDFDDKDELLILDKNALLHLAGVPLKYMGSFPPDYEIKDSIYMIGEFYNKRTNFTHFVVIGKDKKAIYDPIFNSVTYKEGVLKSIRIFA